MTKFNASGGKISFKLKLIEKICLILQIWKIKKNGH